MYIFNNSISIICLTLLFIYCGIYLSKKIIRSSIEKKYRDLEAKIDAEIEQERKAMVEEHDRKIRQARHQEMLLEQKEHAKNNNYIHTQTSFIKNPKSVVFGAGVIEVREKVEPLTHVSEDYIQALENAGARKEWIAKLKKQNKK